MPQCVEFSNGVLIQSQSDIANCVGYVLLTPQEFSSTQSPFFVPLSIQDGALIASSIIALWGMAWVYRALAGTLSPSANEEI